MNFSIDFSMVIAVIMAIAFVVNIIVQMTKEFIPIPTKLWCIIISFIVTLLALIIGSNMQLIDFNISLILLAFFASFVIAFIAMYGFDTFKELWQRFKDGENINGDN